MYRLLAYSDPEAEISPTSPRVQECAKYVLSVYFLSSKMVLKHSLQPLAMTDYHQLLIFHCNVYVASLNLLHVV